MKLAQYLSSNSIRVVDFKNAIGVKSRNTIYRYLRGEQVPEPKIMARIVRATNGAVTANDFYDLQPSAEEARAQ